MYGGRDNVETIQIVGCMAGVAIGVCYGAVVAINHYDSPPVVFAQMLGGAAVGSVLGGAFLPAALPLAVVGGAGLLAYRGAKELRQSSAYRRLASG